MTFVIFLEKKSFFLTQILKKGILFFISQFISENKFFSFPFNSSFFNNF